MTDFDPCYADAEVLSKALVQAELFDSKITGMQLLKPVETPRPGVKSDHAIFQDVIELLEGHSMAAIKPSDYTKVEAIMWDSSNHLLMVCSINTDKRLLIDMGFTRLINDFWEDTLSTRRFACNCALWLSGQI